MADGRFSACFLALLLKYEDVTKIIDQVYLLFFAVPLLTFMIYMATQKGLKGCGDLHGSAKWAEYKDIKNMSYLNGKGVYVGG